MPTVPSETGKAIRTNRKATEKLSGDVLPICSHNILYRYINKTPRMAYPALRTTKEDDNDDFRLLSASTRLQQPMHSIAVCRGVALGADVLHTPR